MHPGSLRGRILRGLGANASGQLLSAAIQLASLPLFLSFWSVEQYGHWLILAAIPGYLSLADLGFCTVAANEMTMLSAQQRYNDANRVFQTALAMTAMVATITLLLAAVIIGSVDADRFALVDARATLLLLIATALLSIGAGLIEAVFRASGHYATGTLLLNAVRLSEWAGMAVALAAVGTPAAAAAGMLLARLVATLLLACHAAQRFSVFNWSFAGASQIILRSMWRPAASFMAFPLGNACLIQGVTLAVGSSLGPAAVAVFNTLRTLARLPLQALATLTRAVWPEVSHGSGLRDYALIKRLHAGSARLAVGLCAALCLVLWLIGDTLVSWWTRGTLVHDSTLLALLLLVSLANSFWQTTMVVLAATNAHMRLSGAFLLGAGACMSVAAMLPAGQTLYGAAWCLLAFEVLMWLHSRRLIRSWFEAAR